MDEPRDEGKAGPSGILFTAGAVASAIGCTVLGIAELDRMSPNKQTAILGFAAAGVIFALLARIRR